MAPGFFESEMAAQYPPDDVAGIRTRILAGRFGELPEVAAAAVFLSSDAASYITGQTLTVDGGVAIT
jgi:3-oxoacyl-[acyl-carrier protein] reductase